MSCVKQDVPPGGGLPPPPPLDPVGALCPRHESREVPSLAMAREPSGLERSLKKTPPVTASPMVPRPVSVMEDPLPGLIGMEMNCQPGHLRLGLAFNMSCSAAWSGI